MKTLSTYAFVAMALVAVSCKKDSTTPAPSKPELLVAKSWKISGDVLVTTTNGQAVTVDNYATADACVKDNFIKFSANKTVIIDEGADKCSGSNQTETGIWDFNSDQTKLTLGAAGTSMVGQYDLVELSATTLKLSQTDTSNGVTEVETVTFTAF